MVYKLMRLGKFIGNHYPYIIGETNEVGIFNDLSVAVADIFQGLIDFGDEDELVLKISLNKKLIGISFN